MDNQLEILDISIDEKRSDIAPLYAKITITEEDFKTKAADYLAGLDYLPLDFLEVVKVACVGQLEGVFGVLKNEYEVSFSIENGDKKKERKNRHEVFTFFECIYSGYGNIPDVMLKELQTPSEHNCAESGLKKIGYITENRANHITEDVLSGRSNPTIVREQLKDKLNDYSRYEGTWKYVKESAVVDRVKNVSEPVLVKMVIRYFDWEYKGKTGRCYYLPTNDTIYAPGLPESSSVKDALKRTDTIATVLEAIYYVVFFIAIGVFIYLGIRGVMKWYKCIFWAFVVIIASMVPLIIGTLLPDSKKKKYKELRLKKSKLHF